MDWTQESLASLKPGSFLNLWYVCSEPKAKGIYMVVGSICPEGLINILQWLFFFFVVFFLVNSEIDLLPTSSLLILLVHC